MRIAELNTKVQAEQGREFNVPDFEGKPTGAKITLRHAQSDMGRAGRAIVQAKVPDLLLPETDPVRRAILQDALVAETLAYLVVSWTFEDECTFENAKALFIGSPYLIDWADRLTSDGGNFFGKASANSATTPELGQDSSDPQEPGQS